MDIYATPGTKVIFTGKGGYSTTNERANDILEVGKQYTVSSTHVWGFSTDVEVEEHPGEEFNSVMFDDLPTDKPFYNSEPESKTSVPWDEFRNRIMRNKEEDERKMNKQLIEDLKDYRGSAKAEAMCADAVKLINKAYYDGHQAAVQTAQSFEMKVSPELDIAIMLGVDSLTHVLVQQGKTMKQTQEGET